jgi:hypothetical protein
VSGERLSTFSGPSLGDVYRSHNSDFVREYLLQDKINNWFTYHAATPEDAERYGAIRSAGKALAEAIVANSPPSADQTAAIRKVREAVATANAAVACKGQ